VGEQFTHKQYIPNRRHGELRMQGGVDEERLSRDSDTFACRRRRRRGRVKVELATDDTHGQERGHSNRGLDNVGGS
jgi:hypothetical protein